jgi:hypothetical protein
MTKTTRAIKGKTLLRMSRTGKYRGFWWESHKQRGNWKELGNISRSSWEKYEIPY